MSENKGGRPTVMTPEVLKMLKEAFSIGGDITEACAYAEISRDAYYDYIKKNPEFSDKVELWQSKPILLSRQTMMTSIKGGNTQDAKWMLEKKRAKEFRNNKDITSDGEKIEPNDVPRFAIEFINSADEIDNGEDDNNGKGEDSE